MKNSIRATHYFYLFLCLACNTAAGSIKNCVINGAKLTLAAGPAWLEAYYYFSLLHKNKQVNQISSQSTQGLIRATLKKHNILQTDLITIENIKPEMQDFTHSAIACTASSMLINTPLFNKLTDTEKEAAIVLAGLRLESKHIRTHAFVLAAIPVVSELLLKLACYASNRLKDKIFFEKIVTLKSYLPSSYFIKLALNSFFTHIYFRLQAKQYDLATARKLKNPAALASFYTKMHTLIKQKSMLLSLRQPSYESRIQYLSKTY